MDQQDDHELGVPNDAKDPIVPLDHNDKQPAVKDRPDHPASKKELICFFLFGVFNNFSYIIMLSAAKDILLRNKDGPVIPVGVVLLADILPTLLVKSTAALYLDKIRSNHRVYIIIPTLFISFHVVAWFNPIPLKLFGIVLSSASSGLGEVTFISLTHHYHPSSVNAFSSGTGGAGLLAALFYVFCTTLLRLSLSTTLAICSLPVLMLWLAYKLLPAPHIEPTYVAVAHSTPTENRRALLKPLILQYVSPVAITYLAQYLINQGINPTIYFSDAPFSERDHYVLYQALYQVTAFLGKSTSKCVPIPYLWLLAALQSCNLVLLFAHALAPWLPNVWCMFLLVLYEGYLAGAIFVNAFYLVRTRVEEQHREFALQVTSAADAIGISAAGVLALVVEPFILSHRTGP
jgi:battenin